MDGESEPTNVFSTSSPVVQNITRRCNNQSNVWNDFKLDPNSEKIVICNYCDKKLKYNGTSSTIAYSKSCKSNPDNDFNKRQITLTPSMNGEGYAISSPSVPGFNQEILQYLLVKLFIAWELPFSKVYHLDFHEFISGLNQTFNCISCTTLARDTLLLWDVEKEKLKKFLALNFQRVCLTSDTWTSIQNLTYMAHFIDNSWTLKNKVLSFVQFTSHSTDVIANTIDACLNDWGLNQILSITLDKAASNDVAIKHLKKKLLSCNRLVLNGEYIHMCCFAHILNLIVKEGLKYRDKSILRIRSLVKCAKSSANRYAKFKECVKQSNSEYKGLACLDVETRWNSIYLMLDLALKHQKAFEVLEIHDPMYTQELVQKGKGVTTSLDWEKARSILPFLKIFYDSTIQISCSSYVASKMYMLEVFSIGAKINNMCNFEDSFIKGMTFKMKTKYNKYLGEYDLINMLLLISSILDPRYKLKFVTWLINQSFDSLEAKKLRDLLDTRLNELFMEYSHVRLGSPSDSQLNRFDLGGKEDLYGYNSFLQCTRSSFMDKRDLEKYLEESIESIYHCL